SGGHINPAVTLGFLVTRRIAPMLAVVYWVAQFSGAVLAALLLKWILPNSIEAASNLGVPSLGSGIGTGTGVVTEAVLTFFLVWVVFATAVDPRGTFKQVADLSTRNKIGLAVGGAAFIVFALVSSFVLPRRNPNFPGRFLGLYITIAVLFFVAMLSAVLIFGREKSEAAGAAGHTTTTASQ